jgi:hypothetical protein
MAAIVPLALSPAQCREDKRSSLYGAITDIHSIAHSLAHNSEAHVDLWHLAEINVRNNFRVSPGRDIDLDHVMGISVPSGPCAALRMPP